MQFSLKKPPLAPLTCSEQRHTLRTALGFRTWCCWGASDNLSATTHFIPLEYVAYKHSGQLKVLFLKKVLYTTWVICLITGDKLAHPSPAAFMDPPGSRTWVCSDLQALATQPHSDPNNWVPPNHKSFFEPGHQDIVPFNLRVWENKCSFCGNSLQKLCLTSLLHLSHFSSLLKKIFLLP